MSFLSPLKGFAFFGLAVLTITGPAAAQSAPDGQAMQLTVRPSGYDAEKNEALLRQKKLLERLDQADHMVRSICINCGDHWKHQIYAPFDPLASLKPSSKTSEEKSTN